MMKHVLVVLLVVFAGNLYAADQVAKEQRYYEFLNAIQNQNTKNVLVIDETDAKLLVDALWDAQENNILPVNLRASLRDISEDGLELSERLRLAVLRYRVRMSYDRRALGTAMLMGLADQEQGADLALLVISLRADLRRMGLTHLVNAARRLQPSATNMSLNTEDSLVGDQTMLARELWGHTPDLSTWMNGRYSEGIRLYMFCRSKRDFPCIQIARDIRGEPVRLENGELWSQPALAKSARNLPSNQRNGNTPAGIHTINGVMPSADQIPSFGKFRRLILDFIPRSDNEQRQLDVLPTGSHTSNWWRPNVVARDMGRDLFRIHGSGRPSDEVNAPWFPFRPTSGCIAKRENTYGGVEFRDQQNLLDTLMKAMDLPVEYVNETKIKGLLFVIEINDEAAPMTMETLNQIGIQ